MEWIVTLTPAVDPDPLVALQRPPDGATMVELRGDLMPELDPATAIANCRLPILYTLRSAAEGGNGPDDRETRRRLLSRARDAGVALIDLEASRDTVLLHDLGLNPAQVILSWHDPSGTPDDLEERARTLLDAPAGLVKIVTTPRSPSELAQVLSLQTRFNRSRRRRLLAFGMGPFGLASRYLAPLLGPPIAYAAWCRGTVGAPGQVDIPRLQAAIGHLHGPPRALHAVVGSDVEESLSPVLHGAAHAATGLHGVLVPFTVRNPEDLPGIFAPDRANVLARATDIPVGGLAVTTPWKEHALRVAATASPRARRAGAANTLVPGSAGLLAENTDADGVRGALVSAGIDPSGMQAVVQGTGGAARGAAVGLDLAGAVVWIRGRETDRTRAVASSLAVRSLDPGASAPAGAILVNATPLGRRSSDPLPFPAEEVAAAGAIVDMVYGEDEPPLGRMAREAGVPYIGGTSVLLHQAIPQFSAMTRTLPSRSAMEAALHRVSGER